MTVSIRPGRYVAAVLQRPNGATRQGPWTPERSQPCPVYWHLHPDERLAYLLRVNYQPKGEDHEVLPLLR